MGKKKKRGKKQIATAQKDVERVEIKEKREKEEKEKLERQKRKHEKFLKKMDDIKPEQIGLVRFVDFRIEKIELVDGKYQHTGREFGHGLQIENRIFLDGMNYKMVNRKSLKIINAYENVPDWATEELKEKYRQMKEYFKYQATHGLINSGALQTSGPDDPAEQ